MTVKNLCSFLILAGIVWGTVAYGDTNVLKNPWFEEGITGWDGRGCKIEAVTTPVHNGSGASKAFGRTETWQGIKQSLLGKVVNGSTYKISAWVRLENSDGDNVIMSIEENDGNNASYINIKSVIASKDEWVQLLGEYTPNAAGSLKTLDVYFEGPAPDVNFFVDDTVVYGPTPAVKAEPNAPKAEPNMPKASAKVQRTEPLNIDKEGDKHRGNDIIREN